MGAGNLSGLLLTTGRLDGEEGAVAAGEKAVSFADRSGDALRAYNGAHDHADALSQQAP